MLTKILRFSLVMVLLTLIAGCTAQKKPGLLIPEVSQGNAPLIDGTLSPGEWDAALQESFTDGSQVSLLVSGNRLYLSIHDKPLDVIIGNVYINRDEAVSILHASAALGSAVYKKAGESWTMTKDFSWSCRDRATARQPGRSGRRSCNRRDGLHPSPAWEISMGWSTRSISPAHPCK